MPAAPTIHRTFTPASAIPIASLLLLLWLTSVSASPAELRAGFARLDITPPLGTPMAGYYHERGADGVLDPLHCRALVLDSEGNRIVLVSLDLISVTRWITDTTRDQLLRHLGIPAHQVMVSATHAHTGPELALRGKRQDVLAGNSPATLAYTESLPALMVQCVSNALQKLEPAEIRWASETCPDLAFNRRYFMRDGSVGWNPGKLNPDIMLPAGPADPHVGILFITPAGSSHPAQSLGSYLNFAMHTDTCGGTRFSADWPGALGRVLATYHGSQHETLVTLAPCGNVNHLDFAWDWPNSGTQEQNRIATLLGASVVRSYKHLEPARGTKVRARSQIVQLAVRPVTAEAVKEAETILRETRDDRGANFMKLVHAYRVLDCAAQEGQPYEMEVQVLALGSDVAWVALPGEAFVELGLAIKKRSPFPLTLVATLSNDNIGYIPDQRSYAEGNYEPISARCAPGSGEKLVDAAVSLLEELHQ